MGLGRQKESAILIGGQIITELAKQTYGSRNQSIEKHR